MPELIKMVRSEDGPPFEADVHPDEIVHFQLSGWRVVEGESVPETVSDEIPDTFPGTIALRKAGVTKFAQLAGLSAVEISDKTGVGSTTAKKIVAKLDGMALTES